MAFEYLVLDEECANEVIDLYENQGEKAALDQMEFYHWKGHHDTIDDHEVCFDEDDIVLSDGGLFLGWINPETRQAGLLFRIVH